MATVIEIPDRSNPVLDALVEGWISHFWSADHQLKWTSAEQEVSIWLDPNTHLGGRIDARGANHMNKTFFADWKTANPRKKKQWRANWRKSIQALTYGVLLREIDPMERLFLIRMAFKDNTYDQEWFEYTNTELNLWRDQILFVAQEIRAWRKSYPTGPWPTNYDYCRRFGVEYLCPYFDHGCDKGQFNAKIGLIPRVSHLDIERRYHSDDPNYVFLDATRLEEWFGCHEKLRKEYEENLRTSDPSDALEFGLAFHELMDVYYKKLIAGKI